MLFWGCKARWGPGAGETDLESVQHTITAGKILRKRAGEKS